MKTSKASARWTGNLKTGNGNINLPTSGQELSFNFASRFEDGQGTNPEELIAAAHAGCFSMALSNLLTEEGYEPDSVITDAKVTIVREEDGFRISKSELKTNVKVSGIDKELFKQLADKAKENCPVSQALASIDIHLEANLNS